MRSFLGAVPSHYGHVRQNAIKTKSDCALKPVILLIMTAIGAHQTNIASFRTHKNWYCIIMSQKHSAFITTISGILLENCTLPRARFVHACKFEDVFCGYK